MCDHTIKLSHIMSSQENKFLFYSKLEHFQSHVMPKNIKFSESSVLTTRISKYWKIEKLLEMALREIKCHLQVIFDCSNAKISKVYASKQI